MDGNLLRDRSGKLLSLVTVLVSLVGLGQLVVAANETALLSVKVYSADLGIAVGNAKVELVSQSSNENLSDRLKAHQAYVPPGAYLLKVTAPGLKRYEEMIKVAAPSTTIRVGLTVDPVDDLAAGQSRPSDGRISGHISSLKRGDRDFWVQAYPIFGPPEQARVTAVTQNGRFDMAVPLGLGTWLVVVIETFPKSFAELPPNERDQFPRVVGSKVVHPGVKLEIEINVE